MRTSFVLLVWENSFLKVLASFTYLLCKHWSCDQILLISNLQPFNVIHKSLTWFSIRVWVVIKYDPRWPKRLSCVTFTCDHVHFSLMQGIFINHMLSKISTKSHIPLHNKNVNQITTIRHPDPLPHVTQITLKYSIFHFKALYLTWQHYNHTRHIKGLTNYLTINLELGF